MSGPNSSSEWSVEGRRLVPLMPRLVPQTAFTVTANAVASATAHQNSALLPPAETGNKEGRWTSLGVALCGEISCALRCCITWRISCAFEETCVNIALVFAVVVCYSYSSTSSTATNVCAPSGSGAPTVKSPRPASPASNVVVLPSGSTVYVKSE